MCRKQDNYISAGIYRCQILDFNKKFCENFKVSRISADKRLLIMFITSRLTCPLSGLGSDEPLPTGVACDAVCDDKISDYFPFNQTIFKTISKDEFKHDSYSFNCRVSGTAAAWQPKVIAYGENSVGVRNHRKYIVDVCGAASAVQHHCHRSPQVAQLCSAMIIHILSPMAANTCGVLTIGYKPQAATQPNCRHAANNSIMPDSKIIDELGG